MSKSEGGKNSAANRQARKAVYVAIAAGDGAALRPLIKSHPWIVNEWKLLMDAAKWGHAPLVAMLLKAGADPNVLGAGIERYRPLHRAVEFRKTEPVGPGHVEVVRLLLEAGADLRLRALDDITPIAKAAFGGHGQFLPLLLDRLDEWDIFTAAVVGDARRVKAMLASDRALASARDINGWTALHYCAHSRVGRAGAAKKLIQTAELLIAAGADPNTSDGSKFHRTPTYAAVGDIELLTCMLAHGGDATVALCRAAHNGELESAEIAIKAGGDLKSPELCELLPSRVHWGKPFAARWLVTHGVPVDSPDARGRTALHWAVSKNLADDFLTMLLDHGARPDLPDAAGVTPLQLAVNRGRYRALALFRRYAGTDKVGG